MKVIESAKLLAASGFSILPIRDTKEKRPAIDKWEPFKDRIMTVLEIEQYFKSSSSLAVICGTISQNLELIDIDTKYDTTGRLLSDFTDLIKELGGESILSKLAVQKTVNNGWHFIYRCSKVEGNQKLARRPATAEELANNPHEKVKVLIETRGEAGYFLCNPSPGYEFKKKDLFDVPVITAEEREILFEAARALNQYADSEYKPKGEQKEYAEGESPFDAYDQSADTVKLLEEHGWKEVFTRGEVSYLRRPGKSRGISATWNYLPGKFYSFTTSSDFEERKSYRPYAVYTVLKHEKDFEKACKALLAAGYGKSYKQAKQEEQEQAKEPIEAQLLSSPELPKSIYHNLPQLLREGCKAFKSYRETDVFVTSALTVLSGCFPQVSGVYNGTRVNANLFGFIVAPAASGKSALVWAKKLGQTYHKPLVEESKRLQQEYEAKLSEHNQAKRHAKRGETVDPPPEPPPFKLLFIPANNSSASIIGTLANCDGQGIIAESEADTLSGTLTQDWGNFSDLLRKAFHHESYTYQRKTGKEFYEIDAPKLSIALSGTPNQVSKLISSSEDGLFSRFVFYSYAVEPKWRDVSPAGQGFTINDHFEELSKVVFQRIKAIEHDIEFVLTADQWQKLNSRFDTWLTQTSKLVSQQASSSVYRLGLICYRLAMVLTIIRAFEEPVLAGDKMECLDKDFRTALELSECYLQHAMLMYANLPKDPSIKGVDGKKQMFFNALPDVFTRAEAVPVGDALKLSRATVDRYLKDLSEKGLLQVRHGNYSKA